MLVGILAPWERLTLAQCADALYDCETYLARYEAQSGQKVGGTMRAALVLGNAPRFVRDRLLAQLWVIDKDWVKHVAVAQYILASGRVYSATAVVADYIGGGNPMDTDTIKGNCYSSGTWPQGGWEAHGVDGSLGGKGGKLGGKDVGKNAGYGSKQHMTGKGRDTSVFTGICGRCKQQGRTRAICPKRPRGTIVVQATGGGAPAEVENAASHFRRGCHEQRRLLGHGHLRRPQQRGPRIGPAWRTRLARLGLGRAPLP